MVLGFVQIIKKLIFVGVNSKKVIGCEGIIVQGGFWRISEGGWRVWKESLSQELRRLRKGMRKK